MDRQSMVIFNNMVNVFQRIMSEIYYPKMETVSVKLLLGFVENGRDYDIKYLEVSDDSDITSQMIITISRDISLKSFNLILTEIETQFKKDYDSIVLDTGNMMRMILMFRCMELASQEIPDTEQIDKLFSVILKASEIFGSTIYLESDVNKIYNLLTINSINDQEKLIN